MQPPPDPSPDSTPDFKRGGHGKLIALMVIVVAGIVAVAALSGVFPTRASKRPREVVDPYEGNKEGGCPCSCDWSQAMAAEMRALGGDGALRGIDESLAIIAEREEAGYVTEAMVSHRLRLLDVERELGQEGTVSAAHTRRLPFEGSQHRPSRQDARIVADGSLRVGMELVVHGQTTEWVLDREKELRACFLLSMEIENSTDQDRVVGKPIIAASAPFPVSRWYRRGEAGEPWDGRLKARERKVVHVIGYVGAPLSPETEVEATIQFESSVFRLTTRARARWDQQEPTRDGL